MNNYLQMGKRFASPTNISTALQAIESDFTANGDRVVMMRDVQRLSRGELSIEQLEDRHTVPAHFAVWRSDTGLPMWVVGSRYHIVQNLDAMLMAEPLVSARGCRIVWAGQFYEGRRTALAFQLPKVIGLGGLKRYPDKWLVWINSFDRSQSLTAYCTLFDPVGQKLWPGTDVRMIKLRHTASVDRRQLEAGKAFEMSNTYLDGVLNTLEWMEGVPPSRDAIQRMSEAVHPLPEGDKEKDKRNTARNSRVLMIGRWPMRFPGGDLVDLYRFALEEIEASKRRRRSTSAAFKSDMGGQDAQQKLGLFHLLITLTEEASGAALPIPEELETIMV